MARRLKAHHARPFQTRAPAVLPSHTYGVTASMRQNEPEIDVEDDAFGVLARRIS
jgi:hypothetical protein